MSDLLVYQTSNPRFADKAIEAMLAADIPCFQTGRGWIDIRPGVRQDPGGGICIYIRYSQDSRRANAILIELGAAVDAPIRAPPKRVLFLVTVAVTAPAIYVVTHWK
jgi:hypothetical protein